MGKYKVGDKFVIVKSGYGGKEWQEGDIVILNNLCGVNRDTFEFKSSEKEYTYSLNFGIDGETSFHSSVRPLKTEAEKRGAKFGVCGVVNNTSAVKRAIGKKISFVKCGENSCKEEVWHCAVEGYDGFTGFLPSSIRLNHEPEYKEIPFSEATHEQRMDVSALRFEDGPVEQIVCFDNGAYAFTTSDCEHACPITEMLTVRIPT